MRPAPPPWSRPGCAAAGIAVRALPVSGLVADLGAEQPAYRVALRADLDALPGERALRAAVGLEHDRGHLPRLRPRRPRRRGPRRRAGPQGAGGGACASAASACGCCSSRPRRSSPAAPSTCIAAERARRASTRVFAVHCDPSLDVGSVGLRDGAITAAADRVTVHLTGRGGHTSRPHLTEDLTFALAKVVTELPAVLSPPARPAHRVRPGLGRGPRRAGGQRHPLDRHRRRHAADARRQRAGRRSGRSSPRRSSTSSPRTP